MGPFELTVEARLLEVFEQPYPTRVLQSGKDWHALFSTESGLRFKVDAVYVDPYLFTVGAARAKEATYHLLLQGGVVPTVRAVGGAEVREWNRNVFRQLRGAFDSFELSFTDRDRGVGITGAARQETFRIFATIVHFALSFFKKARPGLVRFAADTSEPSRVRLYQALVRRLVSGGYRSVEHGGIFYVYHTSIVPLMADAVLAANEAVLEPA